MLKMFGEIVGAADGGDDDDGKYDEAVDDQISISRYDVRSQ